MRKKNGPKNVVNFNYYDIDQFQTLKFHEKIKSLSLFHINACSLSKNFHDLKHPLKCTKKVFDIVAVSETKITHYQKNLTHFQYKFTKLFF